MIFHWVIMNNHVHLLVQTASGNILAKAMQGISLAYTIKFNKKYGRCGQLWQGRFKSIPVEESSYLLECGRYIERNPARAGIVSNAADYTWSSFRIHQNGESDELTKTHSLLEEFPVDSEGIRHGWADYVNTPRDKEEQELRLKLSCGGVGISGYSERLRREQLWGQKPRVGRPKNRSAT